MKLRSGFTTSQVGVLKHLKQSGPSSAKRMAADLDVTPASVRNHLTALEKAGLVSITLKREGTGRPLHVYSLTEEARTFFPNDYEAFITGFIRAVVELDGDDKLNAIFRRMQMDAASQHSPRMEGKQFEDRVAEMARILSDSGYMAEWCQTGKNTFELTEYNCSLLQLAGQYPQVCACELALIRQSLGASVDRQEHILAGDSVCRYVIQRPTSPAKEKAQASRQPFRENT